MYYLFVLTFNFNNIFPDINYDLLYEEDEVDSENVDMKKHGSVITHLLSQVISNMDYFQAIF